MIKIEAPILAIDYGDRHFGIAISDSKGIIATPLKVLHSTKNGGFTPVIDEIVEIAKENRVKNVLIGKPQMFKDSYAKTIEKIENFKNQLSKVINIPIIFQDESYSTTEAQNMLTSLGQNTKRSKSKIDMVSATVFLQEFLNSNNQENEKYN
jgi:putative Holliday junction resolvase